MIKRLSFLILMLASLSVNADDRWRGTKTSVIEDSMCIPELNGEGYLHVDEDVTGLIIQVVGVDGTSVALFDVGTEIEDIAVLGTYAAPSANNVRVSPDALTGGDCTQMMFADAVYAGEDWIQIRVTDGQTTIMDYTRWVYLDLLTSRSTGLVLEPVAITTVTSQTVFVLPSGASNIDAYNELTAYIVGGTEECNKTVTDFTISPPTVTIDSACSFTVVDTTDTLSLYVGASGKQARDTNDLVIALPNSADINLEVDTALADVGLDQFTLVSTTIDTLATQLSFTLVAGSPDDDAYNSNMIVIIDSAAANQKAIGWVDDYVGSTRTVILVVDPLAGFVMAVGDIVLLFATKTDAQAINAAKIFGIGTSGDKWRGTP